MKHLSILFSLLMLVGCEDKAQEQLSPKPEPATPIEKKLGAAVPDETEKKASDTPRPRQKEPGESEAFGQLPEGVGLAVGEAIPGDVELVGLGGKKKKLSELTSNPTLLVFYRGGWCPYCNFQIRQLTKAHPDFKERGVTVVAVSVDSPESGTKTQAAYEIPFAVFSDSDLKLHRAFRVTNQLDEAMVSKLKERGMDVLASAGRDHRTVAIPSAFLIVDGKVAFAHAEKNHRVRPSPSQLLKMLDEAGLNKPTP